MNKELIKKYKTEFNHWIDGGKVIFAASTEMMTNSTRWEYLLSDTEWNIDTVFIQDDEYVEFRKALAEGKTIQYWECVEQKPCISDDKYDWVDWKSATPSSSFTKSLDYRIKPDDWVLDNKEK